MNDVKNFLQDLWSDLQAKRLWPVAGALLLALVAVPVVLSKPAEEPPAPPPPSAQGATGAGKSKDLVALSLLEDDQSGSALDTFGAADPFRPPGSVGRNADDSTTGAQPSSSSGDAGGGAGSSASEGVGATGDTGDSSGGAPVTPVTPNGDDGDGTTTVEYRYVIDVTFTANSRTRRIKGMEKLDLLPSERSPLLVFLGASAKGGNAVFLVDSTLEAAGEGTCKPNASECALLHLGPGSEHEFTSEEGDSYTLRVDQIRKVKVGEPAASKATASAAARTARVAVVRPGAYRRFEPPLLADLVSVSSDAHDNSFSDDDRR